MNEKRHGARARRGGGGEWTAGKLTSRLTRDASATATLTIVVVVTVAIAGGPEEPLLDLFN
jgi:hypothetical protein